MSSSASTFCNLPRALACLCGAAAGIATVQARAASDVTIAAIAVGRLYVVGTTDKPNTPVVLDQKFASISDDRGNFAFEEIYYPTNCVVGVEINTRIYRAVVSNCAQQARSGAGSAQSAADVVRGSAKPLTPAQVARENRLAARRARRASKLRRPIEDAAPARPRSARRRSPVESDDGPLPLSGSSGAVDE